MRMNCSHGVSQAVSTGFDRCTLRAVAKSRSDRIENTGGYLTSERA